MSTKGGIFPPTPRFNEIYDRSLPSPKLFQHIDRVPITMGSRLGICQDRRDRRSCKIFPNCVKFWGNNANSLGNYRVTYALNE